MRPAPLPLLPNMREKPAQMAAETARQLEAMLPDLRRVARQLSPSWSRADDLVQETLLALWQDPGALDPSPRVLRAEAFAALQRCATARVAEGQSTRDVA